MLNYQKRKAKVSFPSAEIRNNQITRLEPQKEIYVAAMIRDTKRMQLTNHRISDVTSSFLTDLRKIYITVNGAHQFSRRQDIMKYSQWNSVVFPVSFLLYFVRLTNRILTVTKSGYSLNQFIKFRLSYDFIIASITVMKFLVAVLYVQIEDVISISVFYIETA